VEARDLIVTPILIVFIYTAALLVFPYVTDSVTRKYFYPPLHAHPAYAHAKKPGLAITDDISNRVLSLPMYSHIEKADIDRVVTLFKQFNHDRKKL